MDIDKEWYDFLEPILEKLGFGFGCVDFQLFGGDVRLDDYFGEDDLRKIADLLEEIEPKRIEILRKAGYK